MDAGQKLDPLATPQSARVDLITRRAHGCESAHLLGRRAFGALASAGLFSALHTYFTPRAWGALPPNPKGSEKVLQRVRSPFNDILVTELAGVRTMYFVVEGVRYIESRWDMNHPHSLDLDYSRTMMAGFLLQPNPRRLAMIGLGGGQITNYLFERFPDLEIDAVDIDPEVVALAHAYFGVPSNSRYRTHVADGRLFIESGSEGWDMVMLDAFRGVFVPYHLKTLEFYRACAAKMPPNGVLTANLHNRVRMYASDQMTFAHAFAHSYNFASESGSQTTFVGARDRQRHGIFEVRRNAKQVAPHFDFDTLGLAARHYLHRDWEDAPILRDDFEPQQLHDAVNRHNAACYSRCNYSTRPT
jgi:spermidine synthase